MHRASKRRKVSGDVSRGMNITKGESSIQHAVDTVHQGKESLDSFSEDDYPLKSSSNGDNHYAAPVHLLAPQTSMSNLTLPEALNYRDTVKIASSPCTDIYSAQRQPARSVLPEHTTPLISSSPGKDPCPPSGPEQLTSHTHSQDTTNAVEIGSGFEAIDFTLESPGRKRHYSESSPHEGHNEGNTEYSLEDYVGDSDDDHELLQELTRFENPSEEISPSAQYGMPLPTPGNSPMRRDSQYEDQPGEDTINHAVHDLNDTYDSLSDNEAAEILEACETEDDSLLSCDKPGNIPMRRHISPDVTDQPTTRGETGDVEAELETLVGPDEDVTPSSSQCIVRRPFPGPVQDRSPIYGVSNNTLLRTCFRVGEALRSGTDAFRRKQDVLLELYARITSSWQDVDLKQHFFFHDLHHDKPPHIEGIMESKGSDARLNLYDVQALRDERNEGIMCRLVGRMVRDGNHWRLDVLLICETDWTCIQHVAGIYARDCSSLNE